MTEQGFIQRIDGDCARIVVPLSNPLLLDKQNIKKCEVRFDDGRTISSDQRKKAYAIIGDIAEWSGHTPPEFEKDILKNEYIKRTGSEYFSLSDCTVTTAREFINFLIDFCFENNIGTIDTLLNHTDDISYYLYTCIANRKCCVCNAKAEIHHCEGSRVGMGFNRNDINNLGRSAIALCRKHHNQAHDSEKEFFKKYHVYGTKLDEYLLKRVNL